MGRKAAEGRDKKPLLPKVILSISSLQCQIISRSKKLYLQDDLKSLGRTESFFRAF